MSNLHFFYGTTGADLTGKLIHDRNNVLQKHSDVWVIKPYTILDQSPKITSSLGLECPAEVLKEIHWKDIILRKEFYSTVIMIDNVQNFKPKDIDSLVKLADTYSRTIHCYGLMVDPSEHAFSSSRHLVEVGAILHEVPSYCQMIGCTNIANHHLLYHRLGYVIHSSKIDDKDKTYIKSVCRRCYDQEMQNKR